MPLFRCTKCGCVENTACCDYWYQTIHLGNPALCSECETGKWHGRFAKHKPTDAENKELI